MARNKYKSIVSALPLRKKYKQLLLVFIASAIAAYTYYQNINQPQQVAVYESIRCIDGDTFWLDDEKIRLLAIDTPEVTSNQPYSYEAKDYTCDLLMEAQSITYSSDTGNEVDKYGRSLYWIFIDDELLQTKILENGYGSIRYVDDNTVNTVHLRALEDAQSRAQTEKLNIWGD